MLIYHCQLPESFFTLKQIDNVYGLFFIGPENMYLVYRPCSLLWLPYLVIRVEKQRYVLGNQQVLPQSPGTSSLKNSWEYPST